MGRGDQKISIYVFGDEFTGKSVDDVVNTVGRRQPPRRPWGRRIVSCAQIRNQLRAVLALAFPELNQRFRRLDGKSALAFLAKNPTP